MRVLVAEDEALIRMDLVEMLQEEGYAVVGEAADGGAAVAMAMELGTGRILTLDSDFSIYRWGRNRPFELLVPLD